MAYETEEEMCKVALNSSYIQSYTKGGSFCMVQEPKGLFGIPDLLIVRSHKPNAKRASIIAFEMKLKNWKRALIQAFKYRAFSNKSYVVIDEDKAHLALRNLEKFHRSNIGLLSVSTNGEVISYFEPSFDYPFCDHYRQKLANLVSFL